MLAVAFIVSCDGSGGGIAKNNGGPDISPDTITTDDSTQSGDTTNLTGNDPAAEGEVDGEDDAEDLGQQTEDDGTSGDSDTTGDGTTADTTGDGTSSDDNQQNSSFLYSLDYDSNSWFKTPVEKLEYVSTQDYENKKQEIKVLRDKIRTLKADAKKAEDKEIKKQLKAEIKKNLKYIASLKKDVGYGKKQKGIHANQANKPLFLKVENAKAGWYKLRVIAKNHGKLPNWYGNFNLSVTNETTSQSFGGLSIKASDKKYNRGMILVKLAEGSNSIKLLWTNDAYKKIDEDDKDTGKGKDKENKGKGHQYGKDKKDDGSSSEIEYDVNLNIRNINLKYAKAKNKLRKWTRNAFQYSEIDGRFFWDNKSVRTYWKDQTIGFNFPDIKSGKYKVTLWAKNYGIVPPEYSNFKVIVDTSGDSKEMLIEADQDKYRKGVVELNIAEGNGDIHITWLNDKYKKDVYDANIQIKRIKIKRIGDYEGSAMTAFLLGVKSRYNLLIIFSALTMSIFALIIITMINRRRAIKVKK